MNNLEIKKQELLQLIEQEKTHLAFLLNVTNDELEFLNNVWASNEVDLIKLASKVSSTDMIIAIALADPKRKKSFSYIYRTISNNRKFLEETDELKLREVLDAFLDLDNYDVYDEVKEAVKPNRKPNIHLSAVRLGFSLVLKLSRVKNIDVYSFMEGLENIPSYIDAMLCTKAIAEIYHSKSKVSEDIDGQISNMKELLGLSESLVKKEFNLPAIRKVIYDARSYYDKEKQNDLSRKRALKRELNAYLVLEENLSNLKATDEIKDIKPLLFRITSEKIRLNLLKIIYLHNQEIYKDLEEQYQALLANPQNIYQALLDNYGLSIAESDLQNIMAKPIEDVKEEIKLLKELALPPEDCITILKNSNLAMVRDILGQIGKGILDQATIAKNLDIFNPQSTTYKNFKLNMDFFLEKGLNPRAIQASQELFFQNPSQLKENINILREYCLLKELKTGTNCQFLSSKNLSEAIDCLLELGCEDNLVEDLSLLNYKENFMRLALLKKLNVPLSSTEEIKDILQAKSFLMDDNKIELYIYNAIFHTKDIPEIVLSLEELEKYSKTSRVYKIGDALISKNKVKRNYNQSNNNIITCITSESILSDEEYDSIINALVPKEINPSLKKVYEV